MREKIFFQNSQFSPNLLRKKSVSREKFTIQREFTIQYFIIETLNLRESTVLFPIPNIVEKLPKMAQNGPKKYTATENRARGIMQ